MEQVKGYRSVRSSRLNELGAWGTELVHEKSGAKICCIENPEDSNKVFAITFRTPPQDDTGVAHILEHSVLCGSEKFPLKDPFVELSKGSVNTFLNAMTFEDKTMYPVASQNERDLYHLMDVYMDAVFHPNILRDPRIMMQEGWHYELTKPEAPVTIKGVVYNEMKGAFSSSDTVLRREINRALFADTPYGYESGGAPEAIPQLTQEKFLAFYKKYYHPSNSFILLYGDMKMEEYLEWLDTHYLGEMTAQEGYGPELLPEQPAFTEPHRVEAPYSVSEAQGENDGYLSYSVAIKPEEPTEFFGIEILKYMLLDAQGAPVKKALTDAGLGKNIYGYVDTRAHQSGFGIVAQGADLKRQAEFEQIIHDVLDKIQKEGFSEKQKQAAMNIMEFRIREGEYGTLPAGLVIHIAYIMNAWLYGKDPFIYTRFDEIFAELREKAGQGYFEGLIRKYLLNNPHAAYVTLRPVIDLAAQEARSLAEKLQQYRESLSEGEKASLVRTTQELLQYQAEEDPPEIKRCVPHLSIADMKKEAEQIETESFSMDGTPCWYTAAECSQILYMRAYLDLSGLSARQLTYASILSTVLGQMDTENHTYEDLNSEINIHTGGISWNVSVLERLDGSYRPEIAVAARCLEPEHAVMAELMQEILLKTQFSDTKRLREILNEEYTSLEEEVTEAGHSIAIQRALSHIKASALAAQYLSGVEYIQFVKDLLDHFDERKDELVRSLQEVREILADQSCLSMAGGSTQQNRETLLECMETFKKALPKRPVTGDRENHFVPEKCNEGLITPGQVQYVVQEGIFDVPYTGVMRVARQILGLEYLWNRLRVQGGAYGAFADFSPLGILYMASYRDPNLASTLETYAQVADYLEHFQSSPEELEKYVIGTIGELDTPLTPALRITVGNSRARIGQTAQRLQQTRDQVLGTTVEQIQEIATAVRQAMSTSCICTVGSKEAIQKEKDRFDRVFEVL